MKKYLMCIGCVLAAMAASAQTVTWDPETWYDADGTGKLNAAYWANNWVSSCDVDSNFGDVNALGPEMILLKINEDGGWRGAKTSNIGTPLQLILNGSASVDEKNNQPCPEARRLVIAQRFLQKGADPNDGLYHQKGNDSNRLKDNLMTFYKIDTPLGYAVRNGKYEIAELLLRNNADPNYTWEGFWKYTGNGAYYDNNAHFPLEQVVTSPVKEYLPNQRVQMVQLLSRYGADANAVDNCGYTPLARLMMCVAYRRSSALCPSFSQYEYLKVAEALVKAGADKRVKGKPQASCQGEIAGVSAYDIWKNYMGQEQKEQWKAFIKGK